MKLVSLNIWGGKVYAPFMEFVKTHAADTDIFCFQEILRSGTHGVLENGHHANILGELTKLLPDFDVFFAPEQDGFDIDKMVDFDISMGQATFVRRAHRVHASGEIFVCRSRNEGKDVYTLPANFLYTRIEIGGKKNVTVANIHGIAFPGHKLDTPERIAQSKKVADFFAGEDGMKIICGDFNLLPATESVGMIERAGLRNLISQYGIKETRGKLSAYYGTPEHQHFADFTFVSPDVAVTAFEVPMVEISDHLPMILEFS